MRLFVALMPPQNVLDEIEAAFGPHHAAWPGLRWTRPESWHVTLAFYGEVDEGIVPRLVPRLERAAARHPARDLAFSGGGTFPRASAARVLWTGLHADLRRLADSCVAAARREGVAVDEHKRFHPHLTVARTRDPLDLRPLLRAVEDFQGTPWAATRIDLVRSRLGAQARYESVADWPLKPL